MARITTLVGIVLTSDSDGEILAAARQLRKELGDDWHSAAEVIEQRDEIATLRENNDKVLRAAIEIKADRDRLVLENEQLKRQANGVSANPWAPVGSPQDQSAWALKLETDGVLTFNDFEQDFLESIAGWEGEITVKQRTKFDQIMTKIVRLTGRRPP